MSTINLSLPSPPTSVGPSPPLPPLDTSRASATVESENTHTTSAWQTVNRRRHPQRKRDERRLRQLEAYNLLFVDTEPYFERFFTIRFPVQNINSDLNVIRAETDLHNAVGKPKKTMKASRNTLLLEASSKSQSDKIRNLRTIANLPVAVSPFSRLNTVRGIVRSKAMSQCTQEELLECLSGQRVTEIRRLKAKRDGELVELDTYILTFQTSALPRVVKLSDWHTELVDEYVERPRQCFRCQKFGHVAKHCRQQQDTCGHCGTVGHKRDSCNNRLTCFHCNAPHHASDKTCPKYFVECEVLKTQHSDKTSRIIALDTVLTRHPQHSHLYDTAQPVANRRPSTSNTLSSASPVASIAAPSAPSGHQLSVPARAASPASPTCTVSSGPVRPISSISSGSDLGSPSTRDSPVTDLSVSDLRSVLASVPVHQPFEGLIERSDVNPVSPTTTDSPCAVQLERRTISARSPSRARSPKTDRRRSVSPRRTRCPTTSTPAVNTSTPAVSTSGLATKKSYSFKRLTPLLKTPPPAQSKRKLLASSDSLSSSPPSSSSRSRQGKKHHSSSTRASSTRTPRTPIPKT